MSISLPQPFAEDIQSQSKIKSPCHGVSLIGDGANQLLFNASSGSETSRGATITWDIGFDSATFSITGTFATEWVNPRVDLIWTHVPAHFPMAAQVVSSTDGVYDLEIDYLSDVWHDEHRQMGITGDTNFSNHFPDDSRVDVTVEATVAGAPYDISVTMAWGEGTADEAASLSAIKALYR